MGRPQPRGRTASARFDTDIPLDALGSNEGTPTRTVASEPAADPDDAPAFVRDAERVRAGSLPARRKALFALALLLLGGLWPAMGYPLPRSARQHGCRLAAPALAAWCGWGRLQRRAAAPARGHRRREHRAGQGAWATPSASIVVLRNRAATVAALPWIELADRRERAESVGPQALGPQDLRARSRRDRRRRRGHAAAALSTGALRVTGYTRRDLSIRGGAPRDLLILFCL